MPLPKDQKFIPDSQIKEFNEYESARKKGGALGVVNKARENAPVLDVLAGFSPGIGDAQAAVDALRSYQEGDYLGMGLNAAGILPFVPALTFGGKLSKGWDAAKAADVEKRLAAGENAAQVWKETGYGVAPWDKQTRREISDKDMQFKAFPMDKEVPLSKALKHQEFSDAYPNLADETQFNYVAPSRVPGFNAGLGKNARGESLVTLNQKRGLGDEGKSSTAHEMQHLVQNHEGFAKGGTPEMFQRDIAEAYDEIGKVNDQMGAIVKSMDAAKASGDTAKYEKYRQMYDEAMDYKLSDLVPRAQVDAEESYRRLGGEAEARLTQARMNMSPEERLAQYPYDPEYFQKATGVPIDKLINHQGGDYQASVINSLRNTDYRGSHTAPGPEFGAPLHDLTGGGQMYPEDVYSAQAARFYGTGNSELDKQAFALAQSLRNKPDELVDIFRSVPNDESITAINPGDWVSTIRDYAAQHGESNLPEGYKILQQKVPAKSVWTNADSIHEYGYHPE